MTLWGLTVDGEPLKGFIETVGYKNAVTLCRLL